MRVLSEPPAAAVGEPVPNRVGRSVTDSDSYPLVGLCGYAGSGKDTAAQALVAQGWERRAFADTIKQVATRIGWNGQKDDAGRRLIQDLGMACCEILDPDVWVRPVLRDRTGPVVITDVRMPNEFEAIKNAGGKIIRIHRPGYGPVNEHITEVALDGYPADAVLHNTHGPGVLRKSLIGAVGVLYQQN